MKNPLKKRKSLEIVNKIEKNTLHSTKTSVVGKMAGKLGVDKKFHKYQDDNIIYDSSFIISPVDAKLVATGPITNGGKIISKSKKEINLIDIIGDQAELFSGGFYLNFYLSPNNRHYWRIPCDSNLLSMSINQGKAKIPVFIGLDKYFKNKDFFKKAILRNANVGLIFKADNFKYAMIPVGSLNVNGIHIVDENNGTYKKGDIGGYFSIGSSMLLCFPKYPLESLVKVGDKVKIGHSIVEIKKV